MSKKLQRVLSLLLVVMMVLPLLPIQHVQAASSNVIQSRTKSEISEFPASYQIGLTRIKEIYPNAQFIYYDTGLDWYADLLQPENELYYGRNLISSKSPTSWLSSDEKSYDPVTGTYNEVEPGWVQASQQVIEYYMDPRNFFNEKDIFQFVSLSFDDAQSVAGTQAVLGSSSFMSKNTIKDLNGNDVTYAQAFYEIGKEYGVSPYLLACRARQEQGNGSALIYGTYPDYEGYYNYFNIGAYGPTTKAIITNGLAYAKSHGWDTPYKSIQGGAAMLKSSYVDSGKNCLYLHHFNVVANSSHKVSYAPYMGAIQAPYYETKSLASSYTDKNAGYTFVIPVYQNMPESPCDLPEGDGNGSYFLKSLSLNDGEMSIGNFSSYKYNYEVATTSSDGFVMIKAELFAKSSKVAINGTEVDTGDTKVLEKGIMLSPGFNNIVLTVTAENGMCRDYVVSVINDDGSSHFKTTSINLEPEKTTINAGTTIEKIKNSIKVLNCSIMIVDSTGAVKDNSALCVSGDKVIIYDKANKAIFTTTLTVYGDIDKDGIVTETDVNLIIDHVLEKKTLSVPEQELADVNKDGAVSVADAGLIRLKIQDVKLEEYNDAVSININIPETTVLNKRSSLTITSDPGTYFAEGFVVYNEGAVKTLSSNFNSGKIHFVADGSKIIFDNAASEQVFSTLIMSQSVEFSIEIVEAYDYISKSPIEIATESKATVVKNTEVAASIETKGSPVAGTDHYNALKLNIANQSSMSLGNITVEFGQFLTNKSGEHTMDIKGLMRWKDTSIDLYTADNLVAGTYVTAVKIRYQSYDGTESLMSLPITFTVAEHDHSKEWKVNENEHYISCKVCDVEIKEAHDYYRETPNKYVCVDCKHTMDYVVSMPEFEAVINKAVVITPTIKLNGKTVKADTYTTQWYVDDVLAATTNDFAYIFKSVGNRQLDCVITLDNGKTLVYNVQVPVVSPNAKIQLASIDCDSIALVRKTGYEYKINNGAWSKNPVFENLTVGTEYTVYQRNAVTKNDASSLRVYTNHNVALSTFSVMCNKDVTAFGVCTSCKRTIKHAMDNTSTACVFENYEKVVEATCKSGTVEEAKCKYGCGETAQRILDDGDIHKFSRYTFDNNANCISAGTETAYCDYGCGTADIKPIVADTAGHNYVYTSDNNATVSSSGTETGICVNCGAKNTKIIYGTRLQYVKTIDLSMSAAVTNRMGLPEILTSNENLVIDKVIWSNSGGVTFEGTADNLIVKSGDTYKLNTLVLVVNDGFAPYEQMIITINGNKYNGQVSIDGKTITLTDVGQFSF